ncbi:MAG: LysR family transcriptional regulator [Caldimonas sp.]
MLDNLQDIRIFTRVVGSGSMSAAARELDLSLALVSKRMAALEARLGIRLLHRTTRRQSLTVEGEEFHERCLRIMVEVADAEALMLDRRGGASGLLSVTATPAFGRQYLAPLVAEFQSAHADVSVRLVLSDDVVDLVSHRIDLAFRFGVLGDSTLMARRVAPNFRVLCAAPSYLERHGSPREPSDLAGHTCIVYGDNLQERWTFRHDARLQSVQVRGRFGVTDGETAQALAVQGAGLLFKSVWEVGGPLDAGQLVQVMPGYLGPSKPLHIVFPHTRPPPRVRRFIDFAVLRLRELGPRLLDGPD